MKVRSLRYISTMAGIAVLIAVFLFFAFDPLADSVGLSKGAGIGLAFTFVFMNAVLVVGVAVDVGVLAASRLFSMSRANG